ncbi:hypothetical protein PYCC9005_001330 [Savitreella phatthalungensis]
MGADTITKSSQAPPVTSSTNTAKKSLFQPILDLPVVSALVNLITFAWFCFLAPLGKNDGKQANRLDKFYQGQSQVYDKTRSFLLRGRERMLRLIASEAAARNMRKPVWVDVGGGTGWNIAEMDKIMPLDQFDKIYLVDLCEPLLDVARARLAQYPNVVVLKGDATILDLPCDQVDIVTLSYSLSMIPPYFKVIDRVLDVLRPQGLVGVVDFFTSNREEAETDRRGNLINRLFWKSWFEFDHVDLNPARRDYLEHRFECIKSASFRNNMVIPWVVSIPYYIYLGQRSGDASLDSSVSSASEYRPTSTVSGIMTPEQTPVLKHLKESQVPEIDMPEPQLALRKSVHGPSWTAHRMPFDPRNPDQAQFQEFIYSFIWEDPDEDVLQMKLNPSDEMLVITSAGCNALDYLVNAGVKSIHCVDMNPCQGHLLELKIAAFKALDYDELWRLFGQGQHDNFRAVLDRLAPHMSAEAYRFWVAREGAFDECFYKSGYAGNVLKVLEWLFWLTRTQGAAHDMARAATLDEQRAAWKVLRRAFISNATGWALLANPVFLWNALGVPVNQLKMLLKEGSALQYAVDTLDPIADQTLLSKVNFHYLLPLLQHYTQACCPAYLRPKNFDLLSRDNAILLDNLTLHTDTINGVLASLPPKSLTKAVVMDHQDWFDVVSPEQPFPCPGSYLDEEIRLFKQALKPCGEVWWRSSAKRPWYADRWQKAGFQVSQISSRDDRKLLDKVNMYASLYRARLPST